MRNSSGNVVNEPVIQRAGYKNILRNISRSGASSYTRGTTYQAEI